MCMLLVTQATRLAELILADLVPNGQSRELMEILQWLQLNCVGHLPLSHQHLARKLEVLTAVLFPGPCVKGLKFAALMSQ
jgi:hypothetical protein